MSETPRMLKFFADGQWRESASGRWQDCHDPSTGEVIARTPLLHGRRGGRLRGGRPAGLPSLGGHPPRAPGSRSSSA